MTKRYQLYVLAIAASVLCCPVAQADEGAPARVRLPQVRINHVDTSQWPNVRVRATLLGKRHKPIGLDSLRQVELRAGKTTAGPPLVQFKEGKLIKNKDLEAQQAREGKVWVGSKAGVVNSVVLVVVGHEHPALKRGSLGPQLREAVSLLLKQFSQDDRVNLIWTSDRLRSAVQLASLSGEFQDIEGTTIRQKCAQARAAALAGEEASLAAKGAEIPPGTDLCGLLSNAAQISEIVSDRAATTFRGKFPRLFNLGKPFYDPTRYCDIPTDRLEGFGDGSLLPSEKNLKRTLQDREERKDTGEMLDFETSAFDEALRLLLRGAKPGENKAVVLISDGHDGYIDDVELCKRRPPKKCLGKSGANRRKCIKATLDKRLTREQAIFANKAKRWIGIARSAGIKVYSLGIAPLARPDELMRLRLLAEKTGGTYRIAKTEARLAQKINDLAAELLNQVVIDFTHPAPEEVEDLLALRIKVRGVDAKGRRVRENSQVMKSAIPPQLGLITTITDVVIDLAVQAQEIVGYKVYLYVGIALLVILSLIFGLIMVLIATRVFRWIGGLFGRGAAQ
ncbi:MAG TPA: hypothetical protein DCQ06_04085 [Myxococcales bacterium]|nr:hypothetical protein [Myxococcales bacterium]HAN30754.1 hypothetical protein [Myxococcales bacterium]